MVPNWRRNWYQRNWYQTGIGTGIKLATIGSVTMERRRSYKIVSSLRKYVGKM